MPLPLILAGIAMGMTALFGAKKGVDAHQKQGEAKQLLKDAQSMFDAEKENLNSQKESTSKELEELGRQKVELWEHGMTRFVTLMKKIKHVKLKDFNDGGSVDFDQYKTHSLEEIEADLASVGTLVTGAGSAGLSGALMGLASYGAVSTLAAAGTGTAIGTLSGVAATNATLAWLGGGTLAAGGAGIAGGMMVLGGLVAGPILAVGGMVFDSKASENLAKAKANYAEAQEAVEKMKNAVSLLSAIEKVSAFYRDVFKQFQNRFDDAIDRFETIVDTKRSPIPFLSKIPGVGMKWFTRKSGRNYSLYSEEEKYIVYQAVQYAQIIKHLLDTPFLDKDGQLIDNSKLAAQESLKQLGRLNSDGN